MSNDRPFVKITNRDIYDKILSIEKKLNGVKLRTAVNTYGLAVMGAALGFIASWILRHN